jgi:hypothetical protein
MAVWNGSVRRRFARGIEQAGTTIMDGFAHGVLGVIALFAGLAVAGLAIVENFLRYLLGGVGMNPEEQTLALLFIEVTLVFGIMRLLYKRVRFIFALLFLLLLLHTLGRIARPFA